MINTNDDADDDVHENVAEEVQIIDRDAISDNAGYYTEVT